MALTYLDSQMIDLPATINTLNAATLSTINFVSQNTRVEVLTALELITRDINFPQMGGYIYNDTDIYGDLTVTGSITALSGLNVLYTIYSTTTALSVSNGGTGVPLYVSQDIPSTDSVVDIKSNNVSVLKINNTLPDNNQPGVEIYYTGSGSTLRVSNSSTNAALVVDPFGRVGINTAAPNTELEVAGKITTTNFYATSSSSFNLSANTIVSDIINADNLNVDSFNTLQTVANSSYNVLLTAEHTHLNNLVVTQVTADHILASNLHALTATINVVDVKVYEMSGFNIDGKLSVTDNVTSNTLSANAAYIPSIVSTNINSNFTGDLFGTFTGTTVAQGTFQGNVIMTTTPPTLSTDTGTQGAIAFDQDFLYVCVSAEPTVPAYIWKRVALSAWN